MIMGAKTTNNHFPASCMEPFNYCTIFQQSSTVHTTQNKSDRPISTSKIWMGHRAHNFKGTEFDPSETMQLDQHSATNHSCDKLSNTHGATLLAIE